MPPIFVVICIENGKPFLVTFSFHEINKIRFFSISAEESARKKKLKISRKWAFSVEGNLGTKLPISLLEHRTVIAKDMKSDELIPGL